MADDAGALLVRSGLVTEQALGLARAKVESEGGTIGEHLVDAGAVADEALTEFYRTRLLVPQVNPNTLARLPQNVVATLPTELAIELRVIPVAVGDGITIAMSDPSSRFAVDEVSRVVGTYVVRSIATQMQLAWCLAHYYGFLTPLGVRLLQPGAAEELRQSAPAHVPRRSRGETSKVNASRHHALVPGAEPAQERPRASLLDKLPTVAPLAPVPEPPPAAEAPKAEESRARTITGEIAQRAARIERVAAISDEPDSGPTVTIEVSPDLRLTRRAPHWVDPPELASRAGELAPRPSAQRAVAAEPAVVIVDEALVNDRATTQDDDDDYASVEIEASASSSGLRPAGPATAAVAAPAEPAAAAAVAAPADDAESGPILLTSRRPTVDLRRRAPTSKEPEPAAPAAVEHEEPSGVVLLAQPKVSRQLPAVVEPEPPQVAVAAAARKPTSERNKRRADKRTQIGLGIEPSKLEPAPTGRAARDTEVSASPPAMAAVTATTSAAPAPAAAKPAAEPPAKAPAAVAAKPASAAAAAKTSPPAAATAPTAPDASKPTAAEIAKAPAPAPAKPPTSSTPDTAKAPTAPAAAKPTAAEIAKAPAPAPAKPPTSSIPDTAKAPTAPAAAKPTAAEIAKAPTAPAAAKPTAAEIAKAPPPAPAKPPTSPATEVAKAPASAATKPATHAPAPAPVTDERPDKRASQRSLPVSDSVDDGWGPPGSTIPPPWLGAIPGGLDATAIPGAIIPLSDESGPLLMAAPSPPQPGTWRSSPSIPIANSPADLVAELEAATSRVVELVRRLDQARTRDEIIELLIFHLLDSHARAGFFTVRHKVVTTFRIEPATSDAKPEMKLDGASTMQDVVDTGLPYRGQLGDEASRQFVAAALGDAPGEILLVPVSVRDRVVGILFADRRKRHTFDEQLAVACRAAGVAFERVLLARRER